MFGLGMGELILIGIVALVFIGSKKLPEMAKNLGKGIRDFQNAAKGFTDEVQNISETPKNDNHLADHGHHHHVGDGSHENTFVPLEPEVAQTPENSDASHQATSADDPSAENAGSPVKNDKHHS